MISNKILATILIITLVISSISIFTALNQLDALKHTAKATDQGQVTLLIRESVSITTIDGPEIDFGACKLLGRTFNITSDYLKDTEESCPNYNQTNISARNNGNIPATLYIETDTVGALRGGTFLESPSNTSDLAYKITNEGRLGNQGGCMQGINATTYTPFFNPNEQYMICEHLNHDAEGGQNSIIANFEIVIPEDVGVGTSQITITFTAHEFI